MAMPRGAGWAATASLIILVLSSRLRALMGVFTRLGGLQKSQGFLVMRSWAIAHLSACLKRRNTFAQVLGA